jgi:SAM-dependent methyltransferase
MDTLEYTVVEGVKCFSPDVADAYLDYPDAGFALTDANAQCSFWVRSRNRLFKWLVTKNLAAARRTRLLEIGCGTGDFIRHLVDDERLEITGSEIYLRGLVYAKRNLPKVEFVQFDVTQGIIDQGFDIIAAFDVLEHIENDRAAMANMNRMLAKGGVAIISVPQHMFMWGPLDEIVKHKRRYSRTEMVAKLAENGFEVTRWTSFVFTLFPLMFVSRLLDRKADDASASDGVALENRVTFPLLVNRLFDLVMRIDEMLIRLGLLLPFGGTLVVVARKR